MKFERKTIIALRRSIDEKWIPILKEGKKEHGSGDCFLCHLFLTSNVHACGGCPIEYFTGAESCKNTPFAQWQAHHISAHIEQSYKAIFCHVCEDLARGEITFLEEIYQRSLLLMEI